MTRRRVVWLVAGVVFVAAVALLFPGSPAYLPDLLTPRGQHEGRTTAQWVHALDDADPEQRYHAIFALGAIGRDAPEAVPVLAAILADDPDPGARIQASLALTKMDPATATVVPTLTQALEDKELLVRMNAAIALFRLRDKARPAVPTLIHAVGNPENRVWVERFPMTVHEQMVLTLGRASAGTADGVPALRAALEAAPSDDVRQATIRALGEVGPEARPAVPLLRQMQAHDNSAVRDAADAALARIDGFR